MFVLVPLACSSCFFGEAGTRWAYYASTALLLLAPFVLVGSSLGWLRRFARSDLAAEAPPATVRRTSRVMTATLVVCLGVLGLAVRMESTPARAAQAPPVLSSMPAFTLSDQLGRPFGTADLDGRVWIASFLFTRCRTVCPALAARVAEIQRRTADTPDLRLVSFSVDPEHDTPEVLAEFGARHGVDPRRWRLLTGPFESVRTAVEEGLRVAMGRGAGQVDASEILHGTKLVLVDGHRRIRGYYDVAGEQGLAALLEAARAVTAEPTAPAR